MMISGDGVLGLLLGTVPGFIAGYLTNSWRQQAAEHAGSKREYKHWYSRFKVIEGTIPTNIAAFLVVALTFWAAITSQLNSNDVSKQQEDNTKAQACTVKFLNDTIAALNSRTEYSVEQNQANTDLQAAQSKFLSAIDFTTPQNQATSAAALRDYKIALTQFQEISGKSKQQITLNAYPTNTELQDCLHS